MSNDNKRQELLAEAEQLGLKFAKNITTIGLEALIKESKTEVMVQVPNTTLLALQAQIDELKSMSTEPRQEGTVNALVKALNKDSGVKVQRGISVDDTPNRDAKLRKALTLIRCTVIPRDPTKTSHLAEVITVSNDLVGDLRYSVPFNEETHIPFFIYKVLKGKKSNVFNDKLKKGNSDVGILDGGYKTIEAYSINVLQPLTQKELDAMAKRRRLRSDDIETREDAILEDEGSTVKGEKPKNELGLLGYDL